MVWKGSKITNGLCSDCYARYKRQTPTPTQQNNKPLKQPKPPKSNAAPPISPKPAPQPILRFPIGNLVFAIWVADGYYYPATITGNSGDYVNVRFISDNTDDLIQSNHIVNLPDAFKNMNFESDWKNGGLYYSCEVKARDDMNCFVRYTDGVNEQIHFSQLRACFKTSAKIAKMFERKK